jgi:ketosteroid isomerase-like protein
MKAKLIVAATLALFGAAAAGCAQTVAGSANGAATVAAQSEPEAVVDAFAAALRAGDAVTVERLMAPDVIIAESGGVERSFAEYASHHMPADMAFSAAVQFKLQHRDVIATDNAVTVISRSEVQGQFQGRAVHSQSMETMVLRRTNGRWRIVHIHWSSSPIRDEQPH